jgi:hypothetical protein
VRILLFFLLMATTSCTPATPPLQLAQDCNAVFTSAELMEGHWLLQPKTLRIRQSALLEIGRKKIPMEGFLRLDLEREEARLLAMNEMGVVLFDLQVTSDGEQLHRVLPQLQQVKGLAQGVAQSLRQIFLRPKPQRDDQFESFGNSQRFLRPLAEGDTLTFLFDCQGELRETRYGVDSRDWRILYGHYQSFGAVRLPQEIVLNDYQHNVKLSLWLREVKEEL